MTNECVGIIKLLRLDIDIDNTHHSRCFPSSSQWNYTIKNNNITWSNYKTVVKVKQGRGFHVNRNWNLIFKSFTPFSTVGKATQFGFYWLALFNPAAKIISSLASRKSACATILCFQEAYEFDTGYWEFLRNRVKFLLGFPVSWQGCGPSRLKVDNWWAQFDSLKSPCLLIVKLYAGYII